MHNFAYYAFEFHSYVSYIFVHICEYFLEVYAHGFFSNMCIFSWQILADFDICRPLRQPDPATGKMRADDGVYWQ